MSSYSTDLKLELMVTGQNAGTWGDKTNTNLNLIQQAISGFEQVTLSSGGTLALAMSNAALSNARNMIIKFATITAGASTVCTIPDSIEKFYIFDCTGVTNPTNLTIKTASGTGFSPDAQKIYAAYSDGTNLTEISLDTLGGTVAAAQIASSAVTTAKIADDAVTFAKMQDTTTANRVLGAASAGTIGEVQVATDMIADDAVTQAKIADDAVGADQLANTTVSAASYTVASITVDAQGRITAASSGQAGGNTEYWHGIKNSGSGNISTTGNVANFYMYGASGGPGPGNRDNPGDRRDGGFGAYGYWNSPIVQPGNSVPYSMGSGGNQGSNPHGNFKGAASNAGNATTIDLGPGTITINGGNGGNAPPNWNTSGTAGTSGNFGGTSPDQQGWSPATYLIGDSNNQSPSQPGRLLFFANDGDA